MREGGSCRGVQGRAPRQKRCGQQRPGEGHRLGLFERGNKTGVAEAGRDTGRVKRGRKSAGLAQTQNQAPRDHLSPKVCPKA